MSDITYVPQFRNQGINITGSSEPSKQHLNAAKEAKGSAFYAQVNGIPQLIPSVLAPVLNIVRQYLKYCVQACVL